MRGGSAGSTRGGSHRDSDLVVTPVGEQVVHVGRHKLDAEGHQKKKIQSMNLPGIVLLYFFPWIRSLDKIADFFVVL